MKKLYHFFQVLCAVALVLFLTNGTFAQIVVTEDNPYNESFEGSGLGNWTNMILSGEQGWTDSYEDSHTGLKSASFSSGVDLAGLMGGGGLGDLGGILGGGDYSDLLGGASGSSRLTSPVLDLSGMGNQTTLKFYRKQAASMMTIALAVYYRTSSSGEWIMLGSYNSAASNWTEETLTLPSLSSTYQISFEASTDLEGDVDIMSLLMGMLGGFGGGGSSMDLSSTIFIDDIHIGSGSGSGSGGSTSSCDMPTNLTVSDITETEATFIWDGTADNWTIDVGPAGFNHQGGYTADVAGPLRLSGFTANTSYDFYVRAKCSDGTYSDWARTTFTTAGGTGIAENGAALLTISPNPTTGVLRCSFNNELTNARLQVFDVFGKLLMEQPVTENTTVLDLSDRASGVYFLRVVSDNKVVTTQKVVRR